MKLRDPFGNLYFLKGLLVILVGWLSWYGFALVNKMRFKGLKNLKSLPKNGVMFVSNHQTYYADVVAINHGFHKARMSKDGRMIFPISLFWPKVHTYYVAAKETMKNSGLLPKLLSYAGAILVKRTWREKGQTIDREVDTKDQDNVGLALKDGWIITFPQGTTKSYAPLRKGTAYIIKENNPIVVPINIDGFRRAFEKKGLFFKKKGIDLKIEFKTPIRFNKEDSVDDILARISKELEQDNLPKSIVLKEGSDSEKS
jgi:1-acyl-sn-glycerol-3-phosphate acyltransferase